MTRRATTRRKPALPLPSERLAPWLGAALFVAGLNALVLGVAGPSVDDAVLGLSLVGVLVGAGLVAARSSAAARAAEHEERQRPALEELFAAADAFAGPAVRPASAYLQGMERWTEAMLELTDHAVAVPAAPREAVAELEAAGAATRDLQGLLRATIDVPIGVNGMATLHGLCTSWEADQLRVEHLGAHLDPRWHQRWQARRVVERRLRRGARPAPALVLPYRS